MPQLFHCDAGVCPAAPCDVLQRGLSEEYTPDPAGTGESCPVLVP